MSVTDMKPQVLQDSTGNHQADYIPPPGRIMTYVLIGGVILPILSILFEFATRICSFMLDPIPTNWHIALLFTVPVANLIAWIACRRRSIRYAVLLQFMLGISLGTAFVYSLLFIYPVAVISVLGILAYGLGLLGLSPYTSLAASVYNISQIEKISPTGKRRRRTALMLGIILSFGILGIFIFSNYITVSGLEMAASKDEVKSSRGVRLIRTFGSDTALLRACYDLPIGVWTANFARLEDGNGVTRNQARDVYYKVTGRSFNSVPPPKMAGPRSGLTEDFEFDSDVGGTAVNGVVKKLSLSSSRMDAVVDPDGLTAYTEWTMTFTNNSGSQREARTEIALPPGGVVSRLTLWVNGKEREAAFSTRGKVREAYEKVAVVYRQDPVLVTTCGPDRILMQCFPVPPSGGVMKVRLGITSPLLPEDYSKGLFVLPRFVERNFGIGEGVKHSLYVDSSDLMVFDGAAGKSIVTDVDDSGPSGDNKIITCERDPDVRSVWAPDSMEPDNYCAVQSLGEAPSSGPKAVALVIDGSARMKKSLSEVAEAIKDIPENCRFTVISAEDEVRELLTMQPVVPSALGKAADKIIRIRCTGGIDNHRALIYAWDKVAGKDCTILWIHGPQPITTELRSEQLLQRIKRNPGSVRILSVPAVDGRNSVMTELEATGAAATLPRLGTLSSDLKRLFAAWDRSSTLKITRERSASNNIRGKKASSHISRLLAFDEVMAMCASGDRQKLVDASTLAAKYQLVTPVSGAVVLENEEQYKEAELNPVDPAKVPSISTPEPGSLIVLGAGILLLGGNRIVRRLKKKS